MHKAIASLFIDITGLLHFLVAAGFALFLYLVVGQGMAVDFLQLEGVSPTALSFGVIFCVAAYVLFFGFMSIIIRMHQNLDKMNKTLERMADAQDELVYLLAEEAEDSDEDEGPRPTPSPVAPKASPRGPAATRQEPVLRRPST